MENAALWLEVWRFFAFKPPYTHWEDAISSLQIHILQPQSEDWTWFLWTSECDIEDISVDSQDAFWESWKYQRFDLWLRLVTRIIFHGVMAKVFQMVSLNILKGCSFNCWGVSQTSCFLSHLKVKRVTDRYAQTAERYSDRWRWCVWAFPLRCHSGEACLVIGRGGQRLRSNPETRWVRRWRADREVRNNEEREIHSGTTQRKIHQLQVFRPNTRSLLSFVEIGLFLVYLEKNPKLIPS